MSTQNTKAGGPCGGAVSSYSTVVNCGISSYGRLVSLRQKRIKKKRHKKRGKQIHEFVRQTASAYCHYVSAENKHLFRGEPQVSYFVVEAGSFSYVSGFLFTEGLVLKRVFFWYTKYMRNFLIHAGFGKGTYPLLQIIFPWQRALGYAHGDSHPPPATSNNSSNGILIIMSSRKRRNLLLKYNEVQGLFGLSINLKHRVVLFLGTA